MIKPLSFLIVFIFTYDGLFAQTNTQKTTSGPPVPSTGIKPKSPTTTQDKKSTTASSSINFSEKTITTTPTIPGEDDARASAIIRTDHQNMPAEVQAKISANKSHGKYLLEGIAKSFLVEIKSCLTHTDHENTLSFLKSRKGFIGSQFISAGKVKIIVVATFDSAELKDAMTSAGIHFNFLSRSYLLTY